MSASIWGDRNSKPSAETMDILHSLDSAQQSLDVALQGQRIELTTITGQVNVLQRDLNGVVDQIKFLISKIDDLKKPNYHFYGLVISICVLGLPLAGLFVTFYTQGTVGPMLRDISSISSDLQSTKGIIDKFAINANSRDQDISKLLITSASNTSKINSLDEQVHRLSENHVVINQDSVGAKADIAQINIRLSKVEDKLSEELARRRENDASQKIALGEIETQFHAVSDIENLRWSWQNRLNAVFFGKTHPGESWSTDSFFPPSVFKNDGVPPIK